MIDHPHDEPTEAQHRWVIHCDVCRHAHATVETPCNSAAAVVAFQGIGWHVGPLVDECPDCHERETRELELIDDVIERRTDLVMED